jgi:hypothetical protein
MVRYLAYDDDANVVERREVERVENQVARRIDGLLLVGLLDKRFDRLKVRLAELAHQRIPPVRVGNQRRQRARDDARRRQCRRRGGRRRYDGRRNAKRLQRRLLLRLLCRRARRHRRRITGCVAVVVVGNCIGSFLWGHLKISAQHENK